MNIFKRGLAAVMLFLLATSCLNNKNENAVVITISNKAQLKSFRNSINSGKSDYYAILTTNIDLEGEEWTPIGINGNYPYKGVFNGNGKTIKNFKITSTEDNQGLFGYLEGGYISNLTVEDADITGGNYVGAICGKVFDDGYIYVCNVKSSTVTATGSYVGGIVGYAATSPLLNCYNDATITGVGSVGGVAGNSTSSTVTNCSNSGTITATSDYAGGVIGYAYSSYITSCYNEGTINGANYSGGVAGRISSTIAACYNTGAVSGAAGVGGVTGYATNFYTETTPTTIAACYNTGSISGSKDVGGVVGETISSTTLAGCYFTTGSASYGIGSLSSDEGTTSITLSDLNAISSDPILPSAIDNMNEAIMDEDASIGYRYTVGTTTPILKKK